MTLIAAVTCDDHITVVADSATTDEFGGIMFRREKTGQVGAHPIVWGCSGAAWLLDDAMRDTLSGFAYDEHLADNLAQTIIQINSDEIAKLVDAQPDKFDPGTRFVNALRAADHVRLLAAGYWPDRGPGILMVDALKHAFSLDPFHLIGSGAEPTRVGLGAIHAYIGREVYNDEVLFASTDAGADFRRIDVGRPFKVWRISKDGDVSSEWRERLIS